MEKALTEIINRTLDSVENGIDLLSNEIPEVISQLLLWHGVYSLLMFLLALVLIYGAYRSWKYLFTGFFGEESGSDPWDYPHLIIPLFGVSVFVVIAVIKMMNVEWLQIWLAPKVWLIEYASKLVNG